MWLKRYKNKISVHKNYRDIILLFLNPNYNVALGCNDDSFHLEYPCQFFWKWYDYYFLILLNWYVRVCVWLLDWTACTLSAMLKLKIDSASSPYIYPPDQKAILSDLLHIQTIILRLGHFTFSLFITKFERFVIYASGWSVVSTILHSRTIIF